MIDILMGNMTIEQFEAEHNFHLTDQERAFFQSTRQDLATVIEKGRWHGFDMPREIVCGDKDMADKVYAILGKYSDQMSPPFRVIWDKEG